jgi:hypothetical protein
VSDSSGEPLFALGKALRDGCGMSWHKRSLNISFGSEAPTGPEKSSESQTTNG